MRFKIAVLADYTNVTNNGKLNIMGIFSALYAQNVPVQHPRMELVIQFAFESHEAGKTKDLTIDLVDADGRSIFTFRGLMLVPRRP